MTNQVAGYELFLPAVSSALYAKKSSDDQLSELEFKQLVEIGFRDAVRQFTKDTLLYRITIPIDVYEGTQRYDIIPPEGWLVEAVVRLRNSKINIPDRNVTYEEVRLLCCPDKDVYGAFFVEVAVSPKRLNGPCEFDCEFLERHYDAILANMMKRFYDQEERTWKNVGKSDRKLREYKTLRNQAKRRRLSSDGPIKLKTRSIPDAFQ